jgi:hypothetical protein
MTKAVDGKLTMTNVTRYAAEQVNPPEGVRAKTGSSPASADEVNLSPRIASIQGP